MGGMSNPCVANVQGLEKDSQAQGLRLPFMQEHRPSTAPDSSYDGGSQMQGFVRQWDVWLRGRVTK